MVESSPETSGPKSAPVLQKLLSEGIEKSIFTAGATAIGTSDGIEWQGTVGTRDPEGEDPVTPTTRFDAASLTKATVMTTIVLRLVEEGTLALSTPLGECIPPLDGTERGEIPLVRLLTHTSGLQPYYYDGWDGPAAAREAIYEADLLECEPGERFEYSCLNFVHLADAVRRVTDSSLAELAHRHVFEPAGMEGARMGPVEETPAVVTHEREHADRVLQGEIHDPIARALEGESGNAGLFASAADLARLATALLGDGRGPGGGRAPEDGQGPDGDRLLSPGTIARMCEDWTSPEDRPHGLGWRLAHECAPAPNWSRASFGHTGYTGTSLWLDPEADRFAVLLTNEVYCGKERGMVRLRERFHGAVVGEGV